MRMRSTLLALGAMAFAVPVALADEPCPNAPKAPIAPNAPYGQPAPMGQPAPTGAAEFRTLSLEDGTNLRFQHDQNLGVLTVTVTNPASRTVAITDAPVFVADSAAWGADREVVFVAVPGQPNTFRLENARLKSAELAGKIRLKVDGKVQEADIAKATVSTDSRADANAPAAPYGTPAEPNAPGRDLNRPTEPIPAPNGDTPNANPPIDDDKPIGSANPPADDANPPVAPNADRPIDTPAPASPTGLTEKNEPSRTSLHTKVFAFGDANFEVTHDADAGSLTLRPVVTAGKTPEPQSISAILTTASGSKTLTLSRVENEKSWRVVSSDLRTAVPTGRIVVRVDGQDRDQTILFDDKPAPAIEQPEVGRNDTDRPAGNDMGEKPVTPAEPVARVSAGSHTIVIGDGLAKFSLDRDAAMGRLTLRLLADGASTLKIEQSPTITLQTADGPRDLTLVAAPDQPNVWTVDMKDMPADSMAGELHVKLADKSYDQKFDLNAKADRVDKTEKTDSTQPMGSGTEEPSKSGSGTGYGK